MTAAAGSTATRRRSARTAAASLSKFRYRESNSADSDDGVKKEEPSDDDDDDDHAAFHDNDDSSLSELSLNSDIEDAIVAPRRRTRIAAAKERTAAPARGKRKRSATAGVDLPAHTKKGGAAARTNAADDAVDVKREIKGEEDGDDERDDPGAVPTPKPKKVRKPARVITTKVSKDGTTTTITTTVEPPTDWELVYNLVKEMRQPGGPAANAAVDTMGCERLALASASPRDRRFHTLVALMLSSQTKDTVNAVAMARLQKELPPHTPGAPPGLNLENMLAVDPALLNQLIWQVGFHNNKTKYLKQAAVILRDQWGGDIPPTAEGLMALPGVGPKMAYLCLAAEHGWNRVEGIGVDVHVHRITNLWGWQKPGSPESKTPEATRLALQSWLPRDKWKEINWLLVGFGQAVCLPQGAKCGDCTLGLRGLCRAANRKKVSEGLKRRRELGEDVEDAPQNVESTVIKEEQAE